MNLFKTSVKNTLYNSLSFFVPIIISLFTTPYIVNKLGANAYGIMGISTLLWGYFSFLDMGIGSGSIKYVAEYFATKNYDKVNDLINSLLLFYVLLGFLGCITTFLLSEYLSVTIFNIPPEFLGIAVFAFQISSVGFLLSVLRPVFDGIPKALNRFDISSKINLIFGTFSTLLVVLVLFLGFGLKEVLIIQLSINLCVTIAGYAVLKFLFPHFRLRIKFEMKIYKMLFSYGVWEIFIKLTNIAIATAGNLIISITLGPASLTYYLIPQNLTTKINTFNFKISEIILPITSQMSSTGDHERLRQIYLKMSKYGLAFRLSVYTPVILLSYDILYYWMGKDFADEGWLVMVFMGLGFFINSFGHIPGLITYGMARLNLTSAYSMGTFFILITLIYPLITLMGIEGASLSYLVSTLVFIPYVFHINSHLLGINTFVFIKSSIFRPFLTALIVGIICLFIKMFLTNFIELIAALIFSFLIYYCVALIIGVFEKDDRDRFYNMVKSKFNLIQYEKD